MSSAYCPAVDGHQREEIKKALDGKGEWGVVVVKVLVFLVILSTFTFAVSTVDELDESFYSILNGVESLCVLVFTVEYGIRFWLADHKIEYVFSFIAIIDLMSILPSWVDLVIPGDVFPALQFLRLLRLFKFLTTSDRGAKGVAAFSRSWVENRSLLAAASFAGGAVWLVTASLQYFAERNNAKMDWCYPPSSPSSSELKCECDDDSCEGSGCVCQSRFSSIPAAMFFVLLNLSGEFPLADAHSWGGRFVAVVTAVVSVGVFAIPTGLVGAALEDSISALDGGEEEDYDVDDDDAALIASETRRQLGRQGEEGGNGKSSDSCLSVPVPVYTTTPKYKSTCGVIICLSALCSVLSTVPSVATSPSLSFSSRAVDLLCAYFFSVEHAARILAMGPSLAMSYSLSFMSLVDTISWLPTLLFLLGGQNQTPPRLYLVVSFFRLLKYERYTHGFEILAKVGRKSGGVLMVGGAAAACSLVFGSALMYYAERHNPDPNMRKYYSSVPTAMWMTMLNLSGEAPLCDYTLAGRVGVGVLSFFAIPIFGIPIGALGAGFEGVISELSGGDKAEEEVAEEGKALLGADTSGTESMYGSVPVRDRDSKGSYQDAARDTGEESASASLALSAEQRLVQGRGPWGRSFFLTSVGATLFAVTLEIVSTCSFAASAPVVEVMNILEGAVVCWFTAEYVLRAKADGWGYACSWMGVVDFFATFPYYISLGVLGPSAARVMDVWDGPLRGLRLLRLVRLDAYAPSLSLVDDAVRRCWPGLKLALYAGGCLWFIFNSLLFFAEEGDFEGGEDRRFRTALSSFQYSGILLTGDYPIKDFTLWGQLLCAGSVLVAVGIVSVPASVLANAFVELLQDKAEKDREQRRSAATKMQRIFKTRRQRKQGEASMPLSAAGVRFACVVKDARAQSAMLRGLDSGDNRLAALCLWRNGSSPLSAMLRTLSGVMIVGNMLAVVLESLAVVEAAVPHALWQAFETVSVLFFTVEYCVEVATARYDPRHNFSRRNKVLSFVGVAELLSIVPFYLESCVLPLLAPGVQFDSTVFRVLRLARVVELERFFTSFSLLGKVMSKSGPVLKATGVLALIVWVGGASLFYYAEPHSDEAAGALAVEGGGEDAAVFESIPDALYYVAIFLAGEWAVVDFTPWGSVLSTAIAAVGVALFSIPVGVLFEGFQEMLEEQHTMAV